MTSRQGKLETGKLVSCFLVNQKKEPCRRLRQGSFLIYCFVGEEVIYKSAIPAADVQTLARISSEQNFPCIFVGEHDICVCQPDDMVKKIFNDYLKVDVLPVKTPEEAIRREIFQMTPFITLEQEKEILPQLPDCESGRWFPAFADITAKGNTGQQSEKRGSSGIS